MASHFQNIVSLYHQVHIYYILFTCIAFLTASNNYVYQILVFCKKNEYLSYGKPPNVVA